MTTNKNLLSDNDIGMITNVKQLLSEVDRLSSIIILSKNKKDITSAFNTLKCIVKGECINDRSEDWDKNVYIVYSLGRCLVPDRFFQLVKERHFGTKRWDYIHVLYKDLFDTIYEDINPDTPVRHSSGDSEDQKCMYTLHDNLKKQAIQLIKKEKMLR